MPAKPKRPKKKGGPKKKGKRFVKKGKRTKLEIAIENYRSIPGKYRELLDAVNIWFEAHAEELINLLKLHVSYSSEKTTYDDFEAALLSMKFPFTKLEIRIISRLFDNDHDGMIQFEDLNTQLSYLSIQDENQAKKLAQKKITPAPQWILARFYCLSCLELSDHPYHFSRRISIDTYTEGLSNIIRNSTGLCTPNIVIFLSSTAEQTAQLQPETTLSDQGLRGGEEWSPVEIGFYYRPVVENQLLCSLTDKFGFITSVHDPVLWSKMTLELDRNEARLARKTALLKAK